MASIERTFFEILQKNLKETQNIFQQLENGGCKSIIVNIDYNKNNTITISGSVTDFKIYKAIPSVLSFSLTIKLAKKKAIFCYSINTDSSVTILDENDNIVHCIDIKSNEFTNYRDPWSVLTGVSINSVSENLLTKVAIFNGDIRMS